MPPKTHLKKEESHNLHVDKILRQIQIHRKVNHFLNMAFVSSEIFPGFVIVSGKNTVS